MLPESCVSSATIPANSLSISEANFQNKPGLSDRVNYGWGWNRVVVRFNRRMVAAEAGLYRFPQLNHRSLNHAA
jgi:hypothetical protein